MRDVSGIAGLTLSALLGAGSIFGAEPPFTLEQALSAPFPSELVAAPAGGVLAFVLDERGARNIWVAGPPEYKARRVTDYSEDDGQELSELGFTRDGGGVVYVRGGEPNRQGEVPNPASCSEGAEQAVWIVPVSGGEPSRLGEGGAPAVSPRGDGVAFVKGGQVQWAPLPGPGDAKLLIKARGEASALRWCADGSKLAFVSQRGNHSFIGVYDVAGRGLRYVDPSVDDDFSPVWSPDGKRIAFIRTPTSPKEVPFLARRAGPPWSIRVVDVATGQGHEAWRAAEGRGSVFREVVARDQVLWGAGDRLVFPWERDGWTQLHAVSVNGGEASALTEGGFEVEHVALAPGGSEVVFSSNQGDVDRRHLWKVAVVGGRPSALTRGSGIEWAPAPLADGKGIALLRSDSRRPARAALWAASGEPRDIAAATLPADFPEARLVAPQAVVFSAADGLPIHGQLFLPANLKPGERRPAVVFFHGGSRRQMLLGWHYMYYYSNAYALNQYLASRGYVVLSANYRSGIGYGMEFREALNYGAGGASEFADVLGAGLYLRSRSDVDGAKIGLWGGSYGGFLTALGLARASDLFAAGVDIHGVHDWNVVIRNFAPSYDPVAREALARRAFESSPMSSVGTWRSPVLLIHGDDDRNVPFSESVELAFALRKQGVSFEQLVFPDEVHDFLVHARWIEAYRAAAAFLAKHLGGAP